MSCSCRVQQCAYEYLNRLKLPPSKEIVPAVACAISATYTITQYSLATKQADVSRNLKRKEILLGIKQYSLKASQIFQ